MRAAVQHWEVCRSMKAWMFISQCVISKIIHKAVCTRTWIRYLLLSLSTLHVSRALQQNAYMCEYMAICRLVRMCVSACAYVCVCLYTSSPVELGISRCISTGEDRRAGEGYVRQRRGKSLITLFCREKERILKQKEWETEEDVGRKQRIW